MTARTALRTLVITSILLYCAPITRAWEYVYDPLIACIPMYGWQDEGTFTVVTADSKNDLIACGRVSAWGPPTRLALVKVTGSVGAEQWSGMFFGGTNWRAFSSCNALTTGIENQVYVAASTAAIDYTVHNFTVWKIMPGGSSWTFTLGKHLGGDYSLSSADMALPDPAGNVIAIGWIDLPEYGHILIKLAGEDGREIWRRNFFSGQYLVDAAGDILIDGSALPAPVGTPPLLLKVSGANGADIWRYGRRTSSGCLKSMLLDYDGNPIVSDGGMIAKIDSTSGEEIWSTRGDVDILLHASGPVILAIDYPTVHALSGVTGQEAYQFNLEMNGNESCRRLAVDRDGDIFAVCGSYVLTKWSGKDGEVIWQQPVVGSAFAIDALGDVTVGGSKNRIANKESCDDTYLDAMAVLHKYWGKTGADFPPSALNRLGYMGSIVPKVVPDHGIANSLIAKLDQATRLLQDADATNDSNAATFLGAFVNEVSAQAGKKISTADADDLIFQAEQAITALSAT